MCWELGVLDLLTVCRYSWSLKLGGARFAREAWLKSTSTIRFIKLHIILIKSDNEPKRTHITTTNHGQIRRIRRRMDGNNGAIQGEVGGGRLYCVLVSQGIIDVALVWSIFQYLQSGTWFVYVWTSWCVIDIKLQLLHRGCNRGSKLQMLLPMYLIYPHHNISLYTAFCEALDWGRVGTLSFDCHNDA